MHRMKRITKLCILLLLTALVAFALVGCSPRGEIDSGLSKDPSKNSYQPINSSSAKSYLRSSMENRKKLNVIDGSEEWFVIDLTLDFAYNDRTDGYEQTSKFTLSVKANWNLADNNKSEMAISIVDPEAQTTVLGIYYLERTMYVTLMDGVAGYENMSYRFHEVNFSTIANLIAPLLNGFGGIDPALLLMSVCSATTTAEIGGFLEKLGIKNVATYLALVDTVAQGIIFDIKDGKSTYELTDGGNTEIVGFRLKANELLAFLKDIKSLLTILGLPGVDDLSWTAFGLPDFDPILQQFFGFSLAKLKENDWPKMKESFWKAVNKKQIIDGKEIFVLDGMELAFACDATDKYPDGQYDVNIRISPFFFGAKKEKINISFSGLGLSTDSPKYRDGGLLNLEAKLSLDFEAPQGTSVTVGDIIGGTIDSLLPNNDLTALKKLPITFNGSNYTDEEGNNFTKYKFDLEIKTDIDLFNGENNTAEINLYSQGKKILSVYLVGTTLYIYTQGMEGAAFSIPNVSIPEIDLTAMLFGNGGALAMIMPYLDPNYGIPNESGGGAASGGGSINAPSNAGAPVDVMGLLKKLVTFKSYYDWKGTKIVNDTGNITLPGSEDSPLVFELDQGGINDLFSLFLPNAELGISSLRVETMLSHPQDSTKIELTLPKNIKLKIQLEKIAWLGRPTFDLSNVENGDYTAVGGDANFFVEMGGDFQLGIEEDENAAKVVLNLSDLIKTLTQNIFLDIGLKVSDTASTKIRYQIKANIDMKKMTALSNTSYISFRDTSFALYLYAGDSEQYFIMLYYNGTDDMLYIDLSKLPVLQETIPLFKIFKPSQPNIKIKLGLDQLLNNAPTLNLSVKADENVSNTDLIMMMLTGTPFSTDDPNNAGAALDFIDLIGKLLEGITIQDDTLSIIASKQLLSVLLTVLNVKLGEGTVLPGTNIVGELNITNPDPEKGFLSLHLGLVGEGGKGKEFLAMDVHLLTKIDVEGNKKDYEVVDPNFNPENYQNLFDVMKKLVVAFELGGKLQLEPMTEGGFSLGDLLAKLIGAKYFDPYFDTVQISSDLEFSMKANIDISGLNIPEGGAIQFDPTTLLNSEIVLEIIDKANGKTNRILGIYYKGGDLYLDLSFFLGAKGYIQLTDAGDFLYKLFSGAKMNAPQRTYDTEVGGLNFNTNVNGALSSIRLGVIASISPYGLTVSLAESALTNLLAGLLGLDSETMIQFGEVKVDLNISDGLKLSFSTSIEDALSIYFELGDLSISANPSDKIIVKIPDEDADGNKIDWIKSDMSNLLTSVLVRLEASIGVGGKGRIDLSPLISSLLNKSDDPNASKIDINVFIDNLGLDGAELNAVIEASLNFQAIAKSMFRISLYRGAVADGDVLLTAIYDGVNNKLYVKTQLFGICNDSEEFKELDIDKLSNSFMKKATADAAEGEKSVEVRNSPFFSLFGALADGGSAMEQFIQIIFVEGGIELKVAEEALVFLFNALGVDASEFFDNFTLEATGKLSIHPVSLSLNAKLNGDAFTFHMEMKNLYLAFGQELNLEDLKAAFAAGKVTTIDSFTSVGVDLKGTLKAEVSSGDASGEILFDELIKNILGKVQLPAGINGATLSTLGLLFKVIGNDKAGFPMFGGTLHYTVGGVINVVNIENLFLTLKLGTTEGAGDVLDVIVRGNAKAGGSGVDIYVNVQKLLGVKPFVIKNVAKFIGIFTGTGVNIKNAAGQTDGLPQLDRSGEVKNLFAGLTMQKEGTDGALANAIILKLASNYEELGLKAPLVLDIGAGALYGILQSLAGIDLGSYLDGHDVFATITAGGSDALLSLDLGLQGLIDLGLNLLNPTIDLQPTIPDAPLGGYTTLDENFTTVRVEMNGHISLKGDFDPEDTNKNTIDLAGLIGNFLTGVNLDVLVNLLGDVDKTMKFSIDMAVNLKKLIVGDWSGLSGKVEFLDTGGNLLIGAYYLDGDLYLDLTALNLGKIRVDNFAVFLQSIIGKSPSSASSAALGALPSDSAERDAALNAAAAAAYINIVLGNDTGIQLEVTAAAIAIILSSISIGDTTLDGQMILDTFNGILSLKLGLFEYDPESDSVHILGLSLNIASYSAEMSIDGAGIDFENTDVRPDDFIKWQQSFGTVGELSEWVYIKAAFTFGWHLSNGMTVDLSDILGTFLDPVLGGFSIEPVIRILSEFGQDFKLEVEGKIHFGNLMRDGTLLPDLIGSGGFNAEVLMNSELSIKLIATTGDTDREVLSLAYVDNNLYIDLSAFSIGKVYVRNAYNFFLDMFAPGNNPAALAYALPYSSNPADNENNSAAYIAKQIGVIGAFVNMNAGEKGGVNADISNAGIALHVGTSGLFAILNLIGLDLSSIGLTLNGLYDLVNPLGDLDIAVWLATQDNLMQLVLSLKEWVKDGEGNILEPSDREIGLKLGIDPNFRIMLGDDKINQEFGEHVVHIEDDPENPYELLSEDALVSVATRLEFHINLKEQTIDNIYKDPLQSLIGSLFAQLAISIGVQVIDEMEGTITLAIKAEIPLKTLIAGITSGGFDLGAINAEVSVLYNGKSYATLILSNGDLFADLTLLGGPKAMIKDMMGLLGGLTTPKGAAADASAPNNAGGAEGDEALLPQLPIELELLSNGFFINIKKAAFNTIFGLINVNGKTPGDWEITDDVLLKLGLTGTDNPFEGENGQSFKLGGQLSFTEGNIDIITLGLDLNGIGAKFSRCGIERPDSTEYANIMDVDTIIAKTSLEFNLKVNDGQEVNLQKVIENLLASLNVANPLGRPIAPQIITQSILQDTLRLDLELAVNVKGFASGNIKDILAGIKVRAKLYSINAPENFYIEIAFDNSVAYIDATSIGFGKIKLPVNSLLEQILGGTSPASARMAEAIQGYGGLMAAPMTSKEAEASKMLATTKLMFGLNGITAIVAYDTISTVLKLLGVPLGDYIDGVIAPSVEIGITDRFGFNIIAHILTGKGENSEDEILQLGLSLVGESTNVDVKVSSVQQIVSFVPEDAESYTNYDELLLTVDINASISVEFLEGYIPLDSVLDLIISNMKMGIDIGETHSVAFSLNGKVGIDLKNFLAKSPTSFFGELSLNYTIFGADGGILYDQTIAKVYIVEEGVFVELKLEDIGLDLRVMVPDLNIPSLIWNLIDGKDPFGTNPNNLHQVASDTTREVPYPAPLAALLNAKAEGKEADNALDILIALNSEGLSIEISTALLATILPLLGLELEDPEALLDAIFSSGKIAISVDPTFRIYFRLQKDAGGDPYIDKEGNPHAMGGYVFELSLFHGTEITTDREKYYKFASRFTSAYEGEGYGMMTSPDFDDQTFSVFAQSFSPFNLKKIISGGGFDVIDDFISTLGGKVEIELGIDFKKLVFDLSALFGNEDNAFFYIKIAEALKSSVKIVLEFDASLKGLIKDAKLSIDAILRFENEYGDNLLTVMVRGGGSGVSSEYEDGVYPAIYLYSESMGIPKLKINSPVLERFINVDLNEILKGLGLNVGDSTQGAARSAQPSAAGRGLIGDENGLIVGGINIANLLDSISIQPGKLSIVLAQSIVKDILAALLDFPFDDVEDISVTISDGLYLNIELQKGFALKMNLSTLEVNLGGRKIFGDNKTEVTETFAGYIPLTEYKWSFELESELTITDDLVSVFSLAKMTSPLIGADVTIEAGEVLGTKMTFLLKGFIDFSDVSNISLQLAMVSGGKQYINIMYIGNADDPEQSWVYLDLTGLGLPAIKLQLDVGSLVKNLLGSLTGGTGGAGAAGKLTEEVAKGAANAMRPAGTETRDGGIITYKDIQWGLDGDGTLDDVPFGQQLLLLAIGSADVSVAITGALLSSLMHGLTSAFIMPDINYIRLGYLEGKMTGIELVLNEENFRIAYSFTDNGKAEIGKDTVNPIDPSKDANGESLNYSMSDIGVIKQVFLGINMEIRINTKNANGEKSPQIEGLEEFVEKLIKLPDGTVDFAPQNASMILNFSLQLALNLEDLKKTQLALTISFGDVDLIGVYFDGTSLYADLSGLGLFEVKISGLDLITLILGLLGDSVDLEGGFNVGDLIGGILPASANNASGGGAPSASSSGYAANAARDAGGVAKLPKIRVVLTNDSLFIIPSMSSIGAIIEKITGSPLGFELPDIAEIRLGINLKEGLNNLSFRLKLDNHNNGVDISIPSDGGLELKLNDPNQSVAMPGNFASYGGISGLGVSGGGIAINVPALVSSLVDSIDAPNSLGIYLKKRNTYFVKTANNAYVYNDSVNPAKDPTKDPLQNGDYHGNDYRNNVQTSAGIIARRDQATNYLELKVDAASRNNSITVRYDACNIKLYLGRLTIKVFGISIDIGSIVSVFAKDGITITQLVIANLLSTTPILGAVGSLSGTVIDEVGEPVKDAVVTATKDEKIRTAETDSLGNYAFTGMEIGTYKVTFTKSSGYYDVIRESVDVKDIQKLDKAQTLNVEMFSIGTTSNTYRNVAISGYVREKNTDKPIVGAKVYIDNRDIGVTDGNGRYYQYYEYLSGTRHSVLVKAANYNEAEATVALTGDDRAVQQDFMLSPIVLSKGIIHGKLVEKVIKDGVVSYVPVTSDVEIWMKTGGSTMRQDLSPYNFLGESQGVRLGTLDSTGAFTIPNLNYGTYTLKFRSKVYKNFDLNEYTVTVNSENPSYIFTGERVEEGETPSGKVFNGQILLERRETDHFTENAVTNAMIGGIRIRLGADILDKDSNGSDAGNVIGGAFEGGGKDATDSVTYIEAWLGENLVTGLLDMVHNLLSSGLANLTNAIAIGTGFADTGADARVSPSTLLQTSNVYNEDDLTVYDYRFRGRADYVRYESAFLAKYPAAFLQNLVSGALKSYLGTVPNFIKTILIGLLGSTLGDIGSLVGMLFPFTVPYNMAENKDLPNNPLEGLNNGGWFNEGERTADGVALRRDINYAEKSVYARIKLNQANEGGMLESIKLFINGAKYATANKGNFGIVSANDFSLADDKIEKTPFQTVSNGVILTNNKKEIDAWLSKNNVNDYIVIDDYAVDPNTGKEFLYNRWYVRNMETDVTADEYFELDIINTGLYLKSAKSLAGGFCNLNGNGTYGEEISLPEKVIFNNPYDLSDFTVVGGSWAAAAGGIRSNSDKSKTCVEIPSLFPTRNKVAFRAGGSSGSSGAAVNWSLSLVGFDAEGGEYEIIGSCLNLEVRVKCVVMPRTISSNDIITILEGNSGKKAIPDIDPYNFREADYIASLPTSFREGTQVVLRLDQTNPEMQSSKYVFDDLKWDLSDVVVTNAGSEWNKPYYIHLTYRFSGGGKGKVDVPVNVLNREVKSISAAVPGSFENGGITDSEITFDPFDISAADAKDALRNIVTKKGESRRPVLLKTVSGSVETIATGIDLAEFANVDFNNLAYNADGIAVYTIYVTVENSEGERTKVPVKVKIQDKRVESTSLKDLTEDERTILPFRKGGMYDKDIGLNNLPAVIDVRHKDGSIKTLTHKTDYIWGLDLGGGNVVFEGKNKEGVDNWKGLMSATGGNYRFRIFGTDKNDIYGGDGYALTIIVRGTTLTSTLPVTFNPYDTIALPRQLAVGVNGGAPDTQNLMNVRWLTLSDDMISLNFSGSVQYSDVEIYDALFKSVVLPGAQVTVKQANVDTIVFPGTDKINPYLAAGEIEKLLADSRTYLTIRNAAEGIRVTKDLYEVISYRITDATLSKVRISVKVGNKGYAAGNRLWTQEFTKALNVLDMTRAVVEPITVGTVFDGLPGEVNVTLDGKTYKVPVTYQYDKITNATGDLPADMAKNFYRTYKNFVPFVPKNLTAVTQNVIVYVNANKAERNDVESFVLDGAHTGDALYAFDNIPMPKTATLRFKDGTTATGLPVVWDGAENYINAAGRATFRGRVGAERFGYYDVEYSVLLERDEVGLTDLPDLIKIDPLNDLAGQLAQYETIGANTLGGTQTLNVEFPVAEFNLSWKGTEARVYTAKIGRKIALTAGRYAYAYQEIPVNVQVLRREAVEIKEKYTGNIYQAIDFAGIQSVQVAFETGELRTSKVSLSDWSNLDAINYNRANVYTVQLRVFGDNPNLTQTVDVKVTVKSAVLVAAYRNYDNGTLSGKVNLNLGEQGYMVVDPFKGFDSSLMPSKLYAQFDGFDEPMLLSADWSVNHIVNAMSVLGGDFTVAARNAGTVMLYLASGADKIRPQQLSFEVRVSKKTVTEVGFSKDANAGEGSSYESLIYDDKANEDKLSTDRKVYYKMFLNPYEIPAYSENPMASDFTYYRAIRVTLEDGSRMYFNIENMEYTIFDAKTSMPTVTSNLYKGRDVIVRIVANKDNIKVDGKQVLASDAIVATEVAVRIYDMTYAAGGEIPADFTVDLYKEYFNYSETTHVVTLAELRNNIKNVEESVRISGKDTLYGSTDAVSAEFDGVNVSTARLNVNYKGEKGFLDYSYGNDVGGMQTVSVTVNYVKRVLETAINKQSTEHYYYVDDSGKLMTQGAYDPTMKLDPTYSKNFKEGFIFDAFAGYKIESFFNNRSTEALFGAAENTTVKVEKEIPIAWVFDKVYIDLNGGTFTVYANIMVKDGAADITQTVKYVFRVIKRKVIFATAAEDPKGDNLKKLLTEDVKTSGINVYDPTFINATDIDAAVGKKVFVTGNPEFTVNFVEGASISYRLGVNAGSVTVGNETLTPEGAMNMSFHIDSLKPLNSKGNDVRFVMTIPGYGMGAIGQQYVYLYVKSQKQEIVSVQTWLTDSQAGSEARSFYEYFTRDIAEGDRTSPTTGRLVIENVGAAVNAVKVNNPYYFINRGGLLLPSSVWVKVRNEKGVETGFRVEGVNWTGTRANYYTLQYTGGVSKPSFTIPVDNQLYSFQIETMPMLFGGTDGIMFDTTSTPYTVDQVVLLPMRENVTGSANTKITNNGTEITDTANYIAGNGYGYRVEFNNKETMLFNGVNGGGNYRNSYNKWDFTSVDFSEYGATQYAMLTLGGRGGEKVKWAIRVSDKSLVSTSMQTVQLAQAGSGSGSNVSFNFNQGSMAGLGGNEQGKLPNRYRQFFSDSTQSAGIPVTYGELLCDGLTSATDTDGKNLTNFTFDSTLRTVGIVSKTTPSNAPIPQDKTDAGTGEVYRDKGISTAAGIKWTATTYRAYPAPNQEVSGRVIFALYPYMPSEVNKDTDSHFRNPDNTTYSYNQFAPEGRGNGWIAPNGLAADADQLDQFYIPQYAVAEGDSSGVKRAVAQNEVPIYQVKKGSMFDVGYLPLFTIGTSVYYVPWNLATVYRTNKNSMDYAWSYNANVIEISGATPSLPSSSSVFSHEGGMYNATVSGGVRGINTGVVGMRYTLVLKIPNAGVGNGNFQLIVAIDIVD